MNNTYLIHHGIKNQKWGVQNGPPYPLGASDHSAAEKAAGTKGWSKEAKASYSVKINKKLSDEQKDKLKKAAIIGASVVGTALVAYGGYKLYSSGSINTLLKIGKSEFKAGLAQEILDDTPIKNVGLGGSKISEKSVKWCEKIGTTPKIETAKEIHDNVNKLSGKEKTNSCVQTSIATFFSRNGVPMTAKADVDGFGIGKQHEVVGELLSIFPELEGNSKYCREFTNTNIAKSKESITEYLLSKFGDNAEGIIGTEIYDIAADKYVGHAFNWSISDGVVSMIDNTRREGFDAFSHFTRSDDNYLGPLSIVRLDHLLDIDENELFRLSKIR